MPVLKRAAKTRLGSGIGGRPTIRVFVARRDDLVVDTASEAFEVVERAGRTGRRAGTDGLSGGEVAETMFAGNRKR
ncbi:hypothetical protein [uncultured Methylobacterium sp.]|uniref:hypothetical protein n=1 Tax=uncultured Methylobacterium sp. TaxID=157278 RepID=UPI00260B55C2|nr:hypothetical protein [uncultured Methylobacterium sp.]